VPEQEEQTKYKSSLNDDYLDIETTELSSHYTNITLIGAYLVNRFGSRLNTTGWHRGNRG
jgi:uncharacterized protein YprB with RNaseH-like and TPR domain